MWPDRVTGSSLSRMTQNVTSAPSIDALRKRPRQLPSLARQEHGRTIQLAGFHGWTIVDRAHDGFPISA